MRKRDNPIEKWAKDGNRQLTEAEKNKWPTNTALDVYPQQ